MSAVRSNSFESGLGEPEQDANSALTDLDKSLRSGKIGEQSEAIVRFPRLFEKYPFPILINSSFLKLADVFRTGTNFLRIWILRVFEQSEKHLDKILNVDEFVRRVYSVMHSNDPVARALTLRTLGACAGIIPERQQVHHSIHRSLDSNDAVEVEAAIKAAEQFAAKSKTFAISMCNKISDMIQGQVTPAYMKLQLIPILQHMHHDTSTAILVRKLCTDLLPKYPSKEFVIVTLKSLTQLSAATLVDIPEQVSLLLYYLRSDPRWPVKAQSLTNLKQLAREGSHLWPSGSIEDIVDVALSTETVLVQSLSLSVILVLVQSPITCHLYRDTNSPVRKLCEKWVFSQNIAIATQAVQILTKIACYCYKEDNNMNINDTNHAKQLIGQIETLIQIIISKKDNEDLHQLKLVLHCAVALCSASPDNCIHFTDLLGFNLTTDCSNETRILLCEALGAIGSIQPDKLLNLLPDFCLKLSELSSQNNNSNNSTTATIKADDDTINKIKVMLCTLVFQAISEYEWDIKTIDILMNVVASSNQWVNYRIARAATRYGHNNIADMVFSNMPLQVSSEYLYFWLMCLKEISKGEARLLNIKGSTNRSQLANNLVEAIKHYSKATTALKAASSPTQTLQFQYEYTKLRTEFLDCLLQLIYACNSLCTAPPPAIAGSTAQTSRDDMQRFGHITQQLRASAKEFHSCGEFYAKLYQTAFDADPNTLENIQILQQMCTIMAVSIERICHPSNSTSVTDDAALFANCNSINSQSLETRLMSTACEKVIKISKELAAETEMKTIAHKHADSLINQVTILANTSLCIPRYFYQVLQSTTVKLSITPQPRVLGESVSVPHGSQLAVKVEGVVQHGGKPGLFRSVKEVIVTVTSVPQTRINHDLQVPNDNNCLTLTQTVTPHRDFFTTQFLLAFAQGGQYVLSIDACLVDSSGCVWRVSQKTTFAVKVYEEPGAKQNQVQQTSSASTSSTTTINPTQLPIPNQIPLATSSTQLITNTLNVNPAQSNINVRR
ncbi:integrator complex subunit 7 [Chrysoperla carnea]|uniref:integrator complex subunit 7 n=1 Tax=Chrysoperla carnea TaxID=189513 RepID=UPI001D08FBD8|nr:integrator complex subunit 7 [Chrysoperla carnea]